jgi:hypothetical protein
VVDDATSQLARDDAQTLTRIIMTMFMKAAFVEEAVAGFVQFINLGVLSLADSDMTEERKLKQMLNDLGCDVNEGDKLTLTADACWVGPQGVTPCMHARWCVDAQAHVDQVFGACCAKKMLAYSMGHSEFCSIYNLVYTLLSLAIKCSLYRRLSIGKHLRSLRSNHLRG